MDDRSIHEKYIWRCLGLAAKGLGSVAPNPMVGCVIVHQGLIIGEGFHQECGKAHAEVNAIHSVKDQTLLKESTLYVNLEPCSHHGKTPPCSMLIIEKGIPNIVIGTSDPNPLVAGKGIEALRSAGRNVTTGILEEQCLYLNRRFHTFHLEKRPYVILKWAQTKDGYIDIDRQIPDKGEVNWITGENARTLVHKWRSEEQAILVGSETVLKDNPSLTARDWPGKNPLRIIIDRRGRINPGHNAMDASAITMIISRKNKTEKNLEWTGIVPDDPLIPQILSRLYKKEIQSVIVEGGALTLNRFIESGLWDEARVFTANREFNGGVKAPEITTPLAEEHEIAAAKLRIYHSH